MPCFIEHEPCALNRMPRIQQPPIKVIKTSPFGPTVLHHALEIRLHKVTLNFLNARVDVSIK